MLTSPQSETDREVSVLLALKARYRELTGEDLSGGAGKKKGKAKSEGKKQPSEAKGKMDEKKSKSGEKKAAPTSGEGEGSGIKHKTR